MHLVYVTVCRWPSGMQVWVQPKPAYQTVTYIHWHIPDVVLIQLIPLMMSTWVLETCSDFGINIYEKELYVKLVIYNYHSDMHGHQNIKYRHISCAFYWSHRHKFPIRALLCNTQYFYTFTCSSTIPTELIVAFHCNSGCANAPLCYVIMYYLSWFNFTILR